MASNVSDYVLERLRAWEITRIFGYPGDGINGLMGAFNRANKKGEGPRFVQARHEEMAAFMASAHAKFTGEVGVCIATSGPGAIHLLNGLYDAKMDHQPVVALIGQSGRVSMGSAYQQEVDLQSLFKDVASEFVHTANVPGQVRHLIDRAVRIAKVERTVTCIIFPKDVQELDAEPSPPREHGSVFTSIGVCSPRVIPREADLRRAAEILNAGQKVAMLVGQGALGASEEVAAVAEVLGAGVAKALLGKAVLPEALPFVTGGIGLLGTKPSWDMMQECDTLLMVGTSFSLRRILAQRGSSAGYSNRHRRAHGGRPLPDRAQSDRRQRRDVASAFALPDAEDRTRVANEDRRGRSRVVGGARRAGDGRGKPDQPRTRLYRALAAPARQLHHHERFGNERQLVRPRSEDSARHDGVALGQSRYDGGRRSVRYRRQIRLPRSCGHRLDGRWRHADERHGELVTIAKYWREWKDPRLVVLVLNNRDLNQVTWEMRAMEGDPKYAASQDIPDFPYASYAESLGLKGIRVDRPEQIVPAWEAAFSADRPVVLDVYTDPDVPTLPPHISFDQARHFMQAMVKGDANTGGIIKESLMEVVHSILPHGGTKK